MMPATLLTLPREIRDYIVIGVLKSPTGFVELLPTLRGPRPSWNIAEQPFCPKFRITPVAEDAERSTDKCLEGNKIINLSLLLICRKLNAECKGLLWQLNTLIVKPRQFLAGCKHLPQRVELQIQNVLISFDLLQAGSRSDRPTTQYAILKNLAAWKKYGSLTSVTVSLARPRRIFPDGWEAMGRSLVHDNLDTLKVFGGPGSVLAGVERKVVLPGEFVGTFDEAMDNLGGSDEVLRKVGEAFDAEVWVDGKLEWAWVDLNDDWE